MKVLSDNLLNPFIVIILAAVLFLSKATAADNIEFIDEVYKGASNPPQVSTQTGAATYAVKIEVPPGRNGIVPNLNLSYNSYKKNGILGVGWSLDLGSIQRSTKYGIDCTSFDFVANGSTELVPSGVSGEYQYYRPKIEGGFSKYYYQNQNDGWIVTTKDGTKYYYGYHSSHNSKQNNDCGIFKWCLDKVQDTNGNWMKIKYLLSDGEIYIDEIEYTGWESESGINLVKFNYESNAYSWPKYNTGGRVETKSRLRSIQVYGNGSLAREYLLEYVNSNISKRSLLTSVSQYDSNGESGGNHLPKTQFTYEQDLPSLAFDVVPSDSWPGYVTNGGRWIAIDLNADGNTDLVHVGSESVNSWISNGNGQFDVNICLPPWAGYVLNGGIWLAGDINTDGKTDLMHVGENCVNNWISNGDGQFDVNINLPPWTGYVFLPGNWQSGDFNGDGKTDLVHIGSESVNSWISNGNGQFDVNICLRPWAGYVLNGGVWRTGDINADGKTDLMHVGENCVNNWISNGDGQFDVNINLPPWAGYVFLPGNWQSGDFNSDGKTDLVHIGSESVNSWISNGNGQFDVNTCLPPWAGYVLYGGIWKTGDFNRDGKTDLMHVVENCVNSWISNGDGQFDVNINLPPWAGYVFIAGDWQSGDFNGDGKSDLVHVSDASYVNSWLSTGSSPPDTIRRIENIHGSSTAIEYLPSSNYINTYLPFIVHTVSKMEIDDGFGNKYATNYFYKYGYFDIEERDFRGFAEVTKTNPNSTTIKTYYNVTDEYLKGRPTLIEAKDSANLPVTETIFSWDSVPIGSTDSMFVKLNPKQTKIYENGSLAFTTTEEYTYYNDHGSVDTKTTSSDADGETITIDKDYDYFSSDGTTYPLRLISEKLEDSTSTIIRETIYDYEQSTGNLLQKDFVYDISSGASASITYSYDDYGNRTHVTDAESNPPTVTEYDSQTHTFPAIVTNPLGHETFFEYDYRFGKVTKATDPNGNETTYTYDEFGREIQVDAPDGGQTVTSYYIDEFPRKIKTQVKENISGDTIDAWQYFDGLGRGIKTISYGEGGSQSVSQKFYDNMGRCYRTEGPFFSTEAGYPVTPPSEGYPFSHTYFDDRGRPTQILSYINSTITDPSTTELIMQFAYNGLSTTVTDPDGSQKTEIKDYLGRLIEVIEYADEGEFYTYYEYNTAGDLLKVKDALNNETIIEYDSLGQKTYMNDPDMGEWSYTYDDNGNLHTQTDAEEQVTTFAYDALNRVTSKTFSNTLNPSANHNVTYTYDIGENGIGKLYSVSNNDDQGTVSLSTMTTYDYDLTGKIRHITYPDGYILEYNYFPGSGLLENAFGVTDFQLFAEFSDYKATGKIGEIMYNNQLIGHTYTYDPWSTRLVGYVTNNALEDLQNRDYIYSPAGDIKSIVDNISGATYNYEYDKLHRLVLETTTGAPACTSAVMLSYSYNNDYSSPIHAVDSVTNNGVIYEYNYDANGNLTSITDSLQNEIKEITYNADNMPVSVTNNEGGSVTADFEYDGNGVREKKTVNGSNPTYYVSNDYEVIDGEAVKYIFAGNMRIARVTDSETYYFHKDHLGSTTKTTNELEVGDADGVPEVVEDAQYMPFGSMRSYWALGDAVSAYKFTDQELDSETGLYNYNARLYDPVIGMFISADTIVPDPTDPQSLNRYSYCRNNPLIYIDPSGHSWASDLWDDTKDVFEDVWKAYVASTTPYYAFKDGGAVGALTWTTGGTLSYSYEEGLGVHLYAPTSPVYAGLSWQERGYNSGLSITAGVGGNYGCFNAGYSAMYNLNHGDFSHNVFAGARGSGWSAGLSYDLNGGGTSGYGKISISKMFKMPKIETASRTSKNPDGTLKYPNGRPMDIAQWASGIHVTGLQKDPTGPLGEQSPLMKVFDSLGIHPIAVVHDHWAVKRNLSPGLNNIPHLFEFTFVSMSASAFIGRTIAGPINTSPYGF